MKTERPRRFRNLLEWYASEPDFGDDNTSDYSGPALHAHDKLIDWLELECAKFHEENVRLKGRAENNEQAKTIERLRDALELCLSRGWLLGDKATLAVQKALKDLKGEGNRDD